MWSDRCMQYLPEWVPVCRWNVHMYNPLNYQHFRGLCTLQHNSLHKMWLLGSVCILQNQLYSIWGWLQLSSWKNTKPYLRYLCWVQHPKLYFMRFHQPLLILRQSLHPRKQPLCLPDRFECQQHNSWMCELQHQQVLGLLICWQLLSLRYWIFIRGQFNFTYPYPMCLSARHHIEQNKRRVCELQYHRLYPLWRSE